MNGRVSKRIRIAASICGKSARTLKREYKALPYHMRAITRSKQNNVARTHGEVLRRYHGRGPL